MATDINTVTLSGRLTKDSELKYTQAGGAIVRFSLAVGRAKRNADGSWGEDTSFIDCTYFGKSAEAVSSYLTKGRQIFVNGELRQNRWESEGQTRSRVEVMVNNLVLASTPRSEGTDDVPKANSYISNNQVNNYQNNQARTQMVSGPESFQDDNIPF